MRNRVASLDGWARVAKPLPQFKMPWPNTLMSSSALLPSTKRDVATAISESALTDCSHRLLELLAWRSKIVPTINAASTSALAKPGDGRQRWQSLAHGLACSSYLPSRSESRHGAPDFALALLRPVPAM